MRSKHWRDQLVVRAPAKVNLFLEIFGKRPDGYHEVATLMLAIGLRDTLFFKEEVDLRLACSRPIFRPGRRTWFYAPLTYCNKRRAARKGRTSAW